MRSWRTWHLLLLFGLGSVVEWAGRALRDWAGAKLKASWFPDDDGDDDEDDEEEDERG